METIIIKPSTFYNFIFWVTLKDTNKKEKLQCGEIMNKAEGTR